MNFFNVLSNIKYIAEHFPVINFSLKNLSNLTSLILFIFVFFEFFYNLYNFLK